MRPFRLVALALVVIALGAYIFFFERHQLSTDEIAERKDKLFPSFEQSAADDIQIRNPHGRFELKREGAKWKLVAPLADDANQGVVTGMLSSFAELKAERTLGSSGVKLDDYGLKQPTIDVTVREKGGRVSRLELGSELPLGNTVAALAGARPAVLLVSKYIMSDLGRDLSGWRSTDLADVVGGEVKAITLKQGDEHIALANSAGSWTLTEPITDLADSDRAQDLISDINSAQIKEFIDSPGSAPTMGLAPPRLEATIVRNGSEGPLQLAFGSERKVGSAKQVACRRGDRLFWVDGGVLAHVSVDVGAWRYKKLLRLETWSAQSLTLAAGGAHVELVRKNGVWRSGATEVNGDPVMERLRDASDLAVSAFDRPVPSGTPLGHVLVTLGAGKKQEATFFPGASVGTDLAVVPGRPGGLAVDAAKVAALLADPTSLATPKPTPAPTPVGRRRAK
jgi:Domain of unknown function (DUF4340)